MERVEKTLGLEAQCHCVYSDDDGDIIPYTFCDDCNGTGEVLTEDGRQLIEFIRKYIFTEISN